MSVPGPDSNPTSNYLQSDGFSVGTPQIAAYMFAGLAMMLNIRLSYSAAPFALLRFKLPENLFSVFVRTTSSALELWCIPSMLIGNIMEQVYNKTQNNTEPHTSALKTAAGTSDNEGLWKLAKELNENASQLEGAAQGNNATDGPALKQKAGENDSTAGTLRYLARLLYETAEALRVAVDNSDSGKARDLAEAVGATESQGLRQKLQQLAVAGSSNLTTQASEVTSAYDKAPSEGVKQKFEAVKQQNNPPHNKYKDHQNEYQEVDKAWEAFDNLYNANLKQLATALKTAVGANELQKALNDLNTSGTTENVKLVIEKFNDVAKAYKAVTALEETYKNISGTSSNYNNVESKFTELQKEYSEAIYKYKFHFLTIPSMFTNWLNFLTFVILLIVFVTGGDQGHVTGYYVIMAASGFVFGINMVLVYAVDYRYLAFYMAGENSFPMVTSLILYFATSIFGNRRKYNSDYLVVVIDVSIAIIIAFVASVLWTWAFHNYRTPKYDDQTPKWPHLVSPVAMVIVGMGLVYSIYPGIAPGMIVPFYLIDKIEMVLLVATAFPPVIIAILRKQAENWSPQTKFVFSSGGFGGWEQYTDNDGSTTVYGWIWHFFDILIPLKITLAIIFIYSLHYRDSNIARSIVNQPKMSTFLTIIFYMCHEILLALGFPGMVGNGGAGGQVLLPVQYVGALLMVFLAFYSIGYITEYKRHDPSQWPTEGMTKWNALCYWLKMASKITNKNFKQLFTTDLHKLLDLFYFN